MSSRRWPLHASLPPRRSSRQERLLRHPRRFRLDGSPHRRPRREVKPRPFLAAPHLLRNFQMRPISFTRNNASDDDSPFLGFDQSTPIEFDERQGSSFAPPTFALTETDGESAIAGPDGMAAGGKKGGGSGNGSGGGTVSGTTSGGTTTTTGGSPPPPLAVRPPPPRAVRPQQLRAAAPRPSRPRSRL